MNDGASGEDPDDMIDRAIEARYRRASALGADEPSEAVRAAILAHAARVAGARRRRPWAIRTLFGAMAAAVLAGFLVTPYLWSHRQALPNARVATAPPPIAGVATAPSAIARTAPIASGELAAPSTPAAIPGPVGLAEQIAPGGSAHSPLTLTRVSPLRRDTAPVAPPTAPGSALAPGSVRAPAQLMAPAPSVDARDSLGRTALMRAVAAGELSTVDALLARGADPNAADAEGKTALQLALEMRADSIAATLRAAGAR
jgi:hypothetical protein